MTSVCLYKVACLHCNNVPEVYNTALHGTWEWRRQGRAQRERLLCQTA